ncbi:unnamed protein product [Calypogeia fissa]
MFIESEFSWTITVLPHQFKNIQKALIRNLLRRFDNTKCTEEHGYFVAVTWIDNVGEGTIREGKGYLTFSVSFRGLTFKPLLGEIVYGTVSRVTEKAVKANFGPGEFAVVNNDGENNMGEFEYTKEEGLWKHKDGATQIEEGSSIRAKIVNIQWFQHLNGFRISCSLKEDFLGVVMFPKKRGEDGA